MRRIATLLICVILLATSSHGAEAPNIDLSHGWPPAQFLAAFDRAAGFEQSARDGEPELRVWRVPMWGSTTGDVISSSGALACNARYRNDGLKASIESAHCVASYMSADTRREALSLAGQLSALDGRSWGCALGGETFFIEGFAEHRRFTFLVSNPADCDDADSKLVTRLVGTLRS
jgi:hypothetical protein